MKFNTLRYLVLPWFLLFCAIIAAMIVEGTYFRLDEAYHQYYLGVLGFGVFLCLSSNLRTLTKAGIWLAHSLPTYLRNKPWVWVLRGVISAGFAYLFFEAGKMSWMPLIWQGAVIPVVFTICLFVTIWSLMGPILVYSSQLPFSRFSAFMLSWPVFVLVPITGVFVGRTVVTAYRESRPDFALRQVVAPKAPTEESTVSATVETEIPPKNKSATELHEALMAGGDCTSNYKQIMANLTTNGESDNVYWAIRSLKCAEVKSVIGLPRLADIMLKHPDAKVRAAAIQAMMKFGTTDVKRIGYLLVKRVGENEPLDVIEAAAGVLLKLGEEERAWVSKRLVRLMDVPRTSALASKILAQKLKREDLVSEFVAKNLTEGSADRKRAISMVCSLSEQGRKIAVPHIEGIVASIQTGEAADPAVKALECLGQPAFEALRKELTQPEKLQKEVAARAFAEASWKANDQEVLATASSCVRDAAPNVREWCSQALGKVGAPAVPGILELLMSNEPNLKSAANKALALFNDPQGKQELMKVRASKSGWMASQKDLEVARAIDKALVNMPTEESHHE